MNPAIMENLTIVARRLNGLGLNDLVFVGGATIGLLLTDEAAPSVRPTLDIDVVTSTGTRSSYYELEARLRAEGFVQPVGEGIPICRWLIDGVPVDVMPTDEALLGFSNRWYKPLVEHAFLMELPEGEAIRVASAPYVVATKLEAFYGRGRGDYRVSHDLEDIIILLDGRSELGAEIASAANDVRTYIAEAFGAFLRNPEFVDSIQGYLDPDEASQAREPIIRERMERIRDSKHS